MNKQPNKQEKQIINISTYTIVCEVISNEDCQLGNNCGKALSENFVN